MISVQRKEDKIDLELVRKTVRLQTVKRLRAEMKERLDGQMDWLDVKEEAEEVEHAYLKDMMKELRIVEMDVDLEFTGTCESDYDFDDEIEHEIIDKIIQECVKAEKEYQILQIEHEVGDQVDECIRTIFCAGNCAKNCTGFTNTLETSSAEEVGCGEIMENMLLSPTCCGKNTRSTINYEKGHDIFPSFEEWLQDLRERGLDDVPEERAEGGGHGQGLKIWER